MMASAALRAAGKEFESLFETIESHRGGQVFEEDGYDGWSSSEKEGAAASAVTLQHQWRLEQKALLDMKSLLSKAKTASCWPSRGASKALDDREAPKPSGLPLPDVALLEAAPAPAKKRKLPTPRKEASKRKGKSPAQEEHTSSPKQKKIGSEKASPAAKPVEKDRAETAPTKTTADVMEVEEDGVEDGVEEVVTADAEKAAPTRASRRAATPASPRKRSRGALTPTKRKASERSGGARNSTSRSSSQRPARVTSKDFSPVPTVEMKSSSFPCPVESCGNSFGSISTRNCHLNVAHPSMASKHLPYSCNKCPYAAGSLKTIEAHMKSAHRGSD